MIPGGQQYGPDIFQKCLQQPLRDCGSAEAWLSTSNFRYSVCFTVTCGSLLMFLCCCQATFRVSIKSISSLATSSLSQSGQVSKPFKFSGIVQCLDPHCVPPCSLRSDSQDYQCFSSPLHKLKKGSESILKASHSITRCQHHFLRPDPISVYILNNSALV